MIPWQDIAAVAGAVVMLVGVGLQHRAEMARIRQEAPPSRDEDYRRGLADGMERAARMAATSKLATMASVIRSAIEAPR